MEVKMRMIWGSQIKEQPLGAAKCKELDSALEPREKKKVALPNSSGQMTALITAGVDALRLWR